MGLGSEVWDTVSGKNLFRIPDQGGQKGTVHRIRIRNTALYLTALFTYVGNIHHNTSIIYPMFAVCKKTFFLFCRYGSSLVSIESFRQNNFTADLALGSLAAR
jgi:hypothetical protein